MKLVLGCQVIAVAGALTVFLFHSFRFEGCLWIHIQYVTELSLPLTAEDKKQYPENDLLLHIEKSERIHHWLTVWVSFKNIIQVLSFKKNPKHLFWLTKDERHPEGIAIT